MDTRPPDTVLDRVAGLHLFEGCRRRELAAAVALGTPLDVSHGRVLAVQGRIRPELILLVAGAARAFVDDRAVAWLARGACFGGRSTIDDRPATATIVAVGQVELLVYDRRAAWALFDAAPAIGSNLRCVESRLARIGDRRPVSRSPGRPLGSSLVTTHPVARRARVVVAASCSSLGSTAGGGPIEPRHVSAANPFRGRDRAGRSKEDPHDQ